MVVSKKCKKSEIDGGSSSQPKSLLVMMITNAYIVYVTHAWWISTSPG